MHDRFATEPNTDALLDVHGRFSGVAGDPKLTVNAKAKLLLEAVRIFTHSNGDVTLQCVGREDVVVPPLKPGAKPGIGDVPEGYHVIPSPQAQRALLSTTIGTPGRSRRRATTCPGACLLETAGLRFARDASVSGGARLTTARTSISERVDWRLTRACFPPGSGSSLDPQVTALGLTPLSGPSAAWLRRHELLIGRTCS